MSIQRMQGVPAHLEVLKATDKRRNISRCKYSEHKGRKVYICHCEKSGYNKKQCHSSKICAYYVENV